MKKSAMKKSGKIVKAQKPVKRKKLLVKKPKPKTHKELAVEVREMPPETPVVQPVPEVAKEEKKAKKPAPTVENGRFYWTKDTEAAIVEYKLETEQPIRDRIYNERIRHSFEKLAENIFNTFKFTYIDVSPVETQKDCIAHLIMGIDKFKAEEGAGKSFGYFSIIAKNFFILLNNSNYSNWKRHEEIDVSSESNQGLISDERMTKQQGENREFVDLMVKFWDNHINSIFKKKRDKDIAEAIIHLFRNSDRMENFNKKALYLYIRDIARCKTQHITKVINKMMAVQKNIREDYLSTGAISDNRIKALKY
jgi:hypothetical protein